MHAERLIEVVLCNNLIYYTTIKEEERDIYSIERDLAMASRRETETCEEMKAVAASVHGGRTRLPPFQKGMLHVLMHKTRLERSRAAPHIGQINTTRMQL